MGGGCGSIGCRSRSRNGGGLLSLRCAVIDASTPVNAPALAHDVGERKRNRDGNDHADRKAQEEPRVDRENTWQATYADGISGS